MIYFARFDYWTGSLYVMNNTEEKPVDIEEHRPPSESQAEAEESKQKLIYKKPELRKYTQIDYVTAYGVD